MLSHLQPRFKKFFILIVLLATLGFADALYMSVEHYRGEIPPCGLTGGCEQVTTSQFATIAGVPVAYMGALYYFVVLFGLFLFVDQKKGIVFKGITLIVTFGFLFSLYLTFLQFFIIKALCAYCLLSALTSTILAILLWFCTQKKLFH